MADRVDKKTAEALGYLVDDLTRERDALIEEGEKLRRELAEDVKLLYEQRSKIEGLTCGMESALEERDEARAEAAELRERLKTCTGKLKRICAGQEYEYDLAEKAIVAMIMDASYCHGPVEVRLGYINEYEDSSKRIVLTEAPDGVIRELMESDLVSHVDLRADGLEICPIPRGLHEIHGV